MALLRNCVEKTWNSRKCVGDCFPFPQFPLPTLISLKTLKRLVENTTEWVIQYTQFWFTWDLTLGQKILSVNFYCPWSDIYILMGNSWCFLRWQRFTLVLFLSFLMHSFHWVAEGNAGKKTLLKTRAKFCCRRNRVTPEKEAGILQYTLPAFQTELILREASCQRTASFVTCK